LGKEEVNSNQESIITSQTRVCSLLQIRGSIPFRWKQAGLKTYEIVGEAEEWMGLFKQHFAEVH